MIKLPGKGEHSVCPLISGCPPFPFPHRSPSGTSWLWNRFSTVSSVCCGISVPPRRAAASFQRMKHDSSLLPKLQAQLEAFLAAHEKFREVIYDTQGIRDDGTDMIL